MIGLLSTIYEFAEANGISKEKVDELIQKGKEKGLNEVNLVFFVKSELNKLIRLRNITREVVVIAIKKTNNYLLTVIENDRLYNIKTNNPPREMKIGVYVKRGVGSDSVFEFKQPLTQEIKQKILEKIDSITSRQLLENNYLLNKVYKLKGKVVEIIQKQKENDIVYDIVVVDSELLLPENLVFYNSLNKIPEFTDVYVLLRAVELNGEKRVFIEGIIPIEEEDYNIIKL